MVDICMIRRKDRVLIRGESYKGKMWIAKNILSTDTVLTIQAELLEDMINNIQEEDLIVEVR